MSALPAQSQEIQGRIVDGSDSKGLAAVNVLLFRPDDTVMFKGTFTDKEGRFAIRNIPFGSYRIDFSYIGYEETSKQVVVKGESTDLGTVSISKAASGMSEVVVVARKPLYEVKADRMVVNVKSSITSAGLSILDVLERSPGVLVSRQNNSLSLSGKSGVRIMINGKVTNMPPEAIYQMLAGMSSSSVDKIELITTPPSSLDAEGNAGYINIVLNKNPNDGTNGSLTLGAGYRNKPLYNTAVDINHRKGRLNIFGNYSFSRDPMHQTLNIYRDITNNGITTSSFTNSERIGTQTNHFGRIGLDYQLTKKTVAGFLISGYDTRWEMDALNTMNRVVPNSPDTLVISNNKELNHWKNYGINLNISHQFTKAGKLNADVDRIHYFDENPSTYTNNIFSKTQHVGSWETRSSKTTPIDMYIAKMDYEVKLNKSVNMEAGWKAGSYKFNNNVAVQNLRSGEWHTDSSLSNNSKLNEVIWAGYAAFSLTLSQKTSAKLGLRFEHTRSLLENQDGERVVDRKYGNFFPTASLSHRINDNNSISLAYAKRITRPTFNQLAPFVLFFDPYTFFSGNPALQPALTDNLTMNYAFKSMAATFSYSYDKNPISGVQATVDTVTGISVVGAINMESMKTTSMSLSIPVKVTEWWKMQNVLTGQYQEVRDKASKRDIFLSSKNAQFSSTQNFSFKKGWGLEGNFNYNTGGLMGRWLMKPVWTAAVGGQKKFNKGGTVKFNIHDLFMTGLYRFTGAEASWSSWFSMRGAKRTYTLTYVLNFGSNTVKSKRQRSTGADSEGRVE